VPAFIGGKMALQLNCVAVVPGEQLAVGSTERLPSTYNAY
jgi:hypothetical protein